MDILFDEARLLQLVTNLYVLTGITANILDPQGRDIHLFKDHPPFCRAINDLPEGHRRCVRCDMWKVANYNAEKGFQFYRCHAGICEAVLPLYDRQQPLAYLVFGCFLDDSPKEVQWEHTRGRLSWYPGGADRLRPAFFQFRQYSTQQLRAYSETLEALSAYIRLQGMILRTEQTDLQRLELYIDQHYMEKLSLATVAKGLHIGRTKLCGLAKELSGGHTLSWLIARRRTEAAKRLLVETRLPISLIAEEVGVNDYNYFSKVFRSMEGATPSAFRKAAKKAQELEKKKQELRRGPGEEPD
ncbi:MAG: helix-turn-helix domain-containing protein [Angelakisella sp.]|jgi:AraC-like DNA-binding protein|nr:helix-turn-helix domain-containing protein [Angelakisella sp.]MCI9529728.1 helix-turn-helix domain-containing protein [Angelakisella sp.]